MPTTRKKADYRPAPRVHRPVSDHVTTFVVAVALALVALVYGVEGATVGLPLRMLSAQVGDFTRMGIPGAPDDGDATETQQAMEPEQAMEPDQAIPPPADENVELSPPPWDLDDWADAAPAAPVEETVLPLPPPQAGGNAQGGIEALQAQIDELRQQLAITQSTVVKLQEIVGILAASEWKSAAALPPPSLPPVKPAHKTTVQEPTMTESPSDTAEDGVDTETVAAPLQAPDAEPPPTDELPAPSAPVPAPESPVAAPPVAAPPLPTDSVGAPALPPGIQDPGALPPTPEVPKGPPPAPLPQKRGWGAWFWGLLGR